MGNQKTSGQGYKTRHHQEENNSFYLLSNSGISKVTGWNIQYSSHLDAFLRGLANITDITVTNNSSFSLMLKLFLFLHFTSVKSRQILVSHLTRQPLIQL